MDLKYSEYFQENPHSEYNLYLILHARTCKSHTHPTHSMGLEMLILVTPHDFLLDQLLIPNT